MGIASAVQTPGPIAQVADAKAPERSQTMAWAYHLEVGHNAVFSARRIALLPGEARMKGR